MKYSQSKSCQTSLIFFFARLAGLVCKEEVLMQYIDFNKVFPAVLMRHSHKESKEIHF